jgi:hypothetical protein
MQEYCNEQGAVRFIFGFASGLGCACSVGQWLSGCRFRLRLRLGRRQCRRSDPKFAQDLLRVLDEKRVVELAKAQEKFASIQIEAGARVAKNQRHVIMAYAVMWIAAALFVLFLWRRQKSLREQIDGLRSDLASALKDSK